MFENAAYVDVDEEATKMKSALVEGGHVVSSFTSTSSISDWTSGTVVIPELEASSGLAAASPAGAFEQAVRSYVSSGGVYVVACECTARSDRTHERPHPIDPQAPSNT